MMRWPGAVIQFFRPGGTLPGGSWAGARTPRPVTQPEAEQEDSLGECAVCVYPPMVGEVPRPAGAKEAFGEHARCAQQVDAPGDDHNDANAPFPDGAIQRVCEGRGEAENDRKNHSGGHHTRRRRRSQSWCSYVGVRHRRDRFGGASGAATLSSISFRDRVSQWGFSCLDHRSLTVMARGVVRSRFAGLCGRGSRGCAVAVRGVVRSRFAGLCGRGSQVVWSRFAGCVVAVRRGFLPPTLASCGAPRHQTI